MCQRYIDPYDSRSVRCLRIFFASCKANEFVDRLFTHISHVKTHVFPTVIATATDSKHATVLASSAPPATSSPSPAAAPPTRVSWEDFRRNCITHEAFIRSLGRLDNEANITKLRYGRREEKKPRCYHCDGLFLMEFYLRSMKRGKAVLFGHDKWEFMLSLMLGMQVSLSSALTSSCITIAQSLCLSAEYRSDTIGQARPE